MTNAIRQDAARLLSVSVVICAYTEDRWDNLVDAVLSVQRQTMTAEIIVVVDHNPNLLQRARTLFRKAVVLENSQSPGLSGARNSGVAAAGGDIVAFLDDDAIAAPDWLERLSVHYEDPDVAGVGGFIEPSWAGGRPATLPEEFNWVVGCSYTGLPQTVTPVRNLIGCNMSFRRDAIHRVGGFHRDVGRAISATAQAGKRARRAMLHCEDTEFCIRLSQHTSGGVLLYEPGARVQHHVPVTRRTFRHFSMRCYTEGLAKAEVTRLVGATSGLASERSYTLRTLPAGVVREMANGCRSADPSHLVKAGMIVAGFTMTAAGYIAGRAWHCLDWRFGRNTGVGAEPELSGIAPGLNVSSFSDSD